MRKIFIAFCIIFSIISCTDKTNKWQKYFEQDLIEIGRNIRENHPGYVDSLNPNFRKQFDVSFNYAVLNKKNITNYTGYKRYLQLFVNSFKDKHLSLFFRNDFDESMYDSGIFPKYIHNKFIIDSVDLKRYRDTSLLSSEILKIDEVLPFHFFVSNHLTYEGIENILADRIYYAPKLLTHYDLGIISKPKEILIRNKKSEEKRIALQWAKTREKDIIMVQKKISSRLSKDSFSLRSINKSSLWVTIPTFNLIDDSERKSFFMILNKLSLVKKINSLIIDLRGNSGGDSTNGDLLVESIFGKEFVAYSSKILYENVYEEFRTSKQNSKYLRQYYGDKIVSGIDSAMRMGKDLYRLDFKKDTVNYKLNEEISIAKQVIVITDVMCFSACLDFMDKMLLHPKTIHVGLPTGGDSQYIENANIELPSKLVFFSYSTKVYRNRYRKANQAYLPKIMFDRNISNTKMLESWILSNYQY